MGYANHMQEIFHPCPPDEKSESEAILSIACSHLCFRCDLLHVDVFLHVRFMLCVYRFMFPFLWCSYALVDII